MIELTPYTTEPWHVVHWLATVLCDNCKKPAETRTTTPLAIKAAEARGYIVSDFDEYEAYCRRCRKKHLTDYAFTATYEGKNAKV